MSAATQPGLIGLEQFLRQPGERDMLRFTTAGSVDDGKSTLIGRLLYDTKGAYEDQLASIQNSRLNRSTGPIDFSLLTDGLKAEREQGITIDVAYRFFSTPRRKFIIADTPGHEQYTRNMATGASTADLAIILIDARNGVMPQSRRHAYISHLLGIPRLLVAVNKMDLVGYSESVFNRIRDQFAEFLRHLGVQHAQFLPVSALAGDNIITPSSNTAWYSGPTLLDALETAPVAGQAAEQPFRFPVQIVIRPHLDFRGFAGQIASGSIHAGDPVRILPSGRTTKIRTISTFDGDLGEAFAPMSVNLTLEDEIDVSRGDLITAADEQAPQLLQRFQAMVVWMSEQPLETGKSYLLKHTSQTLRATITSIDHRVRVETLATESTSRLALNEIGLVTIETVRPLIADLYTENRRTGGFVLIDPLENGTVGAGMIRGQADPSAQGRVTPEERMQRNSHRPAFVWLPDQPETAAHLERRLYQHGCQVAWVGDVLTPTTLTATGIIALYTGELSPAQIQQLEQLKLLIKVESPCDPAQAQDILTAQGILLNEDGTLEWTI